MKQVKPLKTQTVQVFIRVRKQLPSEQSQEQIIEVQDDNTLLILERTNQFNQKFDHAFNQESQQVEVFQKIYPSLQEVGNGVNMTVFAYGHTGSGKTYTMFGNDWEYQESAMPSRRRQSTFYEDLEIDQNNAGIIPRTIYWLFKLLSQDFYIYCSFLQIYNEKIYDLLTADGKTQPKSLAIHESKTDGMFVGIKVTVKIKDGLSEFAVNQYNDCLGLMKEGEKNRIIRQTSMNAKSSRSHSIFQLLLESNKPDPVGGGIRRAKINLCDLAGSEKINKQESINTAHMLEIRKINLSLTTLGKVIQNLSNKQKLPIPYRESKLTRLLQDSLGGGDTHTILIANIAPGFDNMDETYSTLKFADRARNIIISISERKTIANDQVLVPKLQREIDYLKSLLSLKRSNLNGNDIHFKMLKLQEENDRLRSKMHEAKEVEILIQENRYMKLEIQKMQGAITLIPGDEQQYETESGTEQYVKSESQLPQLPQQHLLYSRTGRQSSQQNPRLSRQHKTFTQNGTMAVTNIENMIKYKPTQNQYSVKRAADVINYHQPDLKQERNLQYQKRRVIERLGELERLQRQNYERMEEQLGQITTIQYEKPSKQQNYEKRQKQTLDHFMNS